MSETPEPSGDSLELEYRGKSIRALLIDGLPWFDALDCLDAIGYEPDAVAAVYRADFPAFARTTCDEAPDPEVPGVPQKVVLLSPVGVWYLTALLSEPSKGQNLAAWAKREASRLCPNPTPGDPHVFLTIREVDGRKELPPYPWKYSGRRAEYQDLRLSDEWLLRPSGNHSLHRQQMDSSCRDRLAAIRAGREVTESDQRSSRA